MKRVFVVAMLVLCGVPAIARAQASFGNFTASVYGYYGNYDADFTGDASVWNGDNGVPVGSGDIAVQTNGATATFGFTTKSGITIHHGGSASITGTAYITWIVLGPATGSSYEVNVTLTSTTNNSADAYTPLSGESALAHGEGPVGAADASDGGPDPVGNDDSDIETEPTYYRITIDENGVGYLTVPFIGQCESQAYGPGFDKKAEGYSTFSFTVTVTDINDGP